MPTLVLTSPMHAKPKEEMEDIVYPSSDLFLHRVLLHMNHVPLRSFASCASRCSSTSVWA